MNEVTESLIKIKEIFSVRNRWIRMKAATNKEGKEVSTQSPEAYAFCLNGALCHVQGTARPKGRSVILDAWNKMHPFKRCTSINYINDYQIKSPAELHKLLDTAIELSKEK